jgi:hypothetical protein
MFSVNPASDTSPVCEMNTPPAAPPVAPALFRGQRVGHRVDPRARSADAPDCDELNMVRR